MCSSPNLESAMNFGPTVTLHLYGRMKYLALSPSDSSPVDYPRVFWLLFGLVKEQLRCTLLNTVTECVTAWIDKIRQDRWVIFRNRLCIHYLLLHTYYYLSLPQIKLKYGQSSKFLKLANSVTEMKYYLMPKHSAALLLEDGSWNSSVWKDSKQTTLS